VRVWVLGSGSSGNAAIVEADGSRVLVDCGMGPRAIANRLRAHDAAHVFPGGIDGIVVTHEHHDHIAHLEAHARALGVPVHLHAGIGARRVRERYEVRGYDAGAAFRVGALCVEALAVPHDAPQVALRISTTSGERRAFGLVTDIGHVPADLAPFLGACDAALVEANYCPELLWSGPYPTHLKRRVSGGVGHLANQETAELASKLVGSRLSRLFLGHISRTNNMPERALATVRQRSGSLDVRPILPGVVTVLDIEADEHRGKIRAKGRPTQLAFGF